jgi:hypothetical protein
MSCFFFVKHSFFQSSFIGEVIPFSSSLTQTWVGMKLENVAYPSSFPHFSLSSMHEAIGEAVLPNNFSKTAQLHLESCS